MQVPGGQNTVSLWDTWYHLQAICVVVCRHSLIPASYYHGMIKNVGLGELKKKKKQSMLHSKSGISAMKITFLPFFSPSKSV